MAPSEKQVLTWKKIWDTDPKLEVDEQADYDEFKRFYLARPDQQEIIQRINFSGQQFSS